MVHPDELSQLTATERAFVMLQQTMIELHNDEETFDEAIDMAEQLLLQPYLPLLARARCHMVLSCDPEPPEDAVEHAKEAVRLLDEDVRRFARDSGVPFPQSTYDEAIRLLHEAEEEAGKDILAAQDEMVIDDQPGKQDQPAAAAEVLDTVKSEYSFTADPDKMDVDQELAGREQSKDAEDDQKPSSATSLQDVPPIAGHALDTTGLARATEQLNLSSIGIDPSYALSPSTTQSVPTIALPDTVSPLRRIGNEITDLEARAATRRGSWTPRQAIAGKPPGSGVLTPEPSDETQLQRMIETHRQGIAEKPPGLGILSPGPSDEAQLRRMIDESKGREGESSDVGKSSQAGEPSKIEESGVKTGQLSRVASQRKPATPRKPESSAPTPTPTRPLRRQGSTLSSMNKIKSKFIKKEDKKDDK